MRRAAIVVAVLVLAGCSRSEVKVGSVDKFCADYAALNARFQGLGSMGSAEDVDAFVAGIEDIHYPTALVNDAREAPGEVRRLGDLMEGVGFDRDAARQLAEDGKVSAADFAHMDAIDDFSDDQCPD